MNPTQSYTILNKLADGAVAEVMLARAESTSEQVVLKVLRPELTTEPEAVGRFLDEAKLCQDFQHPNVVRWLGAGRLPDHRLFMATEFMEGEDLATHLRKHGPLRPDELVKLILPLCDALHYVHERGVIHRDIKPENVFLLRGLAAYQPKLLDFGLALFRGKRSIKTQDGVLLATPEYTPPECIEGAPADARSDLYALGILMYEALTGSPPFVCSNYGELLLKHLREAPPRLPAAAAPLDPVIRRCLAKKPADRFQTAAELKIALQNAGAVKAIPLVQIAPVDQGHGELYGSWEALELIGVGSMGNVHLARHTRLGRKAALKVLKPEHIRNRDVVQRFLQEARSVNQINHEHIVEVYDFVEEPQRVYCVMELLAGKSLAELMAEKPLSIRRMMSMLKQLCAALHAAHDVGVVHRDIKTENVFDTRRTGLEDFVKVLDFGVAKLFDPGGNKTNGTLEGAIIGTPTYMAPEQAAGVGVDARSDVYAVGVILYEMLTGNPPFQAEAFGQLAVQIITQPPPAIGPLSMAGEEIPGGLKQLVMRCLEKEPEKRPQSMAELAGLLEPFAARPTLDMVPIPKRPTRWLIPAMGATVAVALGGLAFALLRSKTSAPVEVPSAAVRVSSVAVQVVPSIPPAEPQPAAKVAEVPPTVSWTLRSSPQGARVVRLDTGEALGNTPLEASIARGAGEVSLRFELEGYEPEVRSASEAADVLLEVAIKPVAKRAPVVAKPASRREEKKAPAKKVTRDDVLDPFSM